MALSSSFCLLIASCILSAFGFDLTWNVEDSLKMPSLVNSQLVCHLNDTIYFIGGRKIENSTMQTSNEIYIFNVTNNTFNKITTKLPGNGAYFASNYICHNRSIYMFGPGTTDGSAAGKIWIFDTINQSLTNISFPVNVSQVSIPCTVINKKNQSIFIVGGQNSTDSVSGQVLQFNFTTNRFVTDQVHDTMPKPAVYGSMCHIVNNTRINGTSHSKDGILFVIGGETADKSPKNRQILEYNISSNQWAKLGINSSLTQSRSFTRSIYVGNNNFILIVGGGSMSNDSFLNTTDIFYVGNYSVLPAFGDRLPNELEFNTVFRYKNELLVMGGYGIVIKKINGTNGTVQIKENIPTIVRWDIPTSDHKNTTWETIGIVAGGCAFMLVCGCSAYLLCGRHKEKEDGDHGIQANYKKYSK